MMAYTASPSQQLGLKNKLSSHDLMANDISTLYRYSVFIGLVVVAAMCVAAWFLSPKGENQT
jgi:hypothetical protein